MSHSFIQKRLLLYN